MSEGRTPTATLTQQRRLEQEDIDILHQIVIRAQNDPNSQEQPKDALLQAYGELHDERRLGVHQDRACFNVLLKLLNPTTSGESLYHKFENILQEEGIELSYDDDATTQEAPDDRTDRHSHGTSEHIRPLSRISQTARRHSIQHTRTNLINSQQTTGSGYYPSESAIDEGIVEAQNDTAYIDNPPPYIAQLLRQAESRDRQILARQTLDAWRDTLVLRREQDMDARADALYTIRLKRKVLKQCLAVFQDLRGSQIRADEIYRNRLITTALGKTSDEYRIRRVASIDDDRVKGLSLYKWTLASREASFVRNKDHQVKWAAFRKLHDSYRARQAQQAQLEHMLRERDMRNRSTLLRSAFSFMTERTNEMQADQARAERHSQTTLYNASICAFRAKMGRLSKLTVTAEDAREYFLMKRVLRRLQDVTRFRKERRHWLAIWTAKKWHEHVNAKKHARYDEAYRQMRRTVKVNLARTMLHRWRQKLRNYTEDGGKADECYRLSIQRRLVQPMIEYTYDTAARTRRDELEADHRARRFLQRRAMTAFQMTQQSLLDMADKADRLRQYRIEQRAVQGLREMQMKAFELQRRHSDADAFRDRTDKRAVRGILARFRRALAERMSGNEGTLALVPPPAVTPARKREELLLNSSTRLSTTPAYTPFAMRLRQEPRILEDIEDDDEDMDIGQDSAELASVSP